MTEARLRGRSVLAAVAMTALLAASLRWAEVRPALLADRRSLAAVGRFLSGLVPPDVTPSFLATMAAALAQTVAIAVAGTALSIALALPLGIGASALLWRRGVLVGASPPGMGRRAAAAASVATRALLGFLRSVPDLVWALLFVVAFGLGPLAGTLALVASYTGVLGRVFADVIDGVDEGPLEALQSTGATRMQVLVRAALPQAAPALVAYALYAFECCLRSASVLGFVGAGGLGYEVALSMRLFEYGQVATLLVGFLLLLAGGDAFSRWTRERLRGIHAPARARLGSRRAPLAGDGPFPRLRPRIASVVAAVGVLVWSLVATGIAGPGVLAGGSVGRLGRLAAELFPPDLDPSFLRGLPPMVLQSIGISVVATALGIGVGGALAIPAAANVMLPPAEAAGSRHVLGRALAHGVHAAARLVLQVLRAIPDLLLVLVSILLVGVGPFAGALGLGVHTAGVLGKLYADTIEEVAPGPVEGLRAAGASRAQLLAWAIAPQARPMLASYTLLRWESNLRTSTVLGLVGGGGIGQAIYNDVQLGFHARVATLVAIVCAMVVASDLAGQMLGRRARVAPEPLAAAGPAHPAGDAGLAS